MTTTAKSTSLIIAFLTCIHGTTISIAKWVRLLACHSNLFLTKLKYITQKCQVDTTSRVWRKGKGNVTAAKVPGKSARMAVPNLTYVALVALSHQVRNVLIVSK